MKIGLGGQGPALRQRTKGNTGFKQGGSGTEIIMKEKMQVADLEVH